MSFYANQTHSPEVGGKDLSRILKSTVKKTVPIDRYGSNFMMYAAIPVTSPWNVEVSPSKTPPDFRHDPVENPMAGAHQTSHSSASQPLRV